MAITGPLSEFETVKQLPPGKLLSLLRVSETLVASLDLDVVLQTAIESAVQVLRLDTGAIYLLDEEVLYLGATTPPLPADFRDEFRLTNLRNHPHIAEAVAEAHPVYVRDARKESFSPDEEAIARARQLRSILYIPLLLEGNGVGVLIVGSTARIHRFTAYEVSLCRTLSSLIALSVTNARLFTSVQQAYRQLTRAYDATLEGWSLALDMRDKATQGHTQRVTDMTLALARRMRVPEPSLIHIRRGALLHDIGKMAIPDAILRHPDALSEDKRGEMQKHPELAYRFLLHIDYLRPALDIPYCHHEKWDGSGYPRGLKGEQIPLAARIFAVVDVFDALVSQRDYREPLSREEALGYIRDQSGRHFDPAVVTAFLRMMEAE
jgi:HD-GYP domain-containing protein (c-di-GMP phosphodiesterase class II)